jgi:hypothetical protein
VHHILDAIMAGDASTEGFVNLELPESYRAVTVHKDEVDEFEGLPSRSTSTRSPVPGPVTASAALRDRSRRSESSHDCFRG